MACYDWALQYAQQRVQFGKPIAAFQLVQQKLVWMLTEITKAQLLVLQVGRLKDQGQARAQQRSEEHTSELQSRLHLVCRLLLEKKKNGERRIVRTASI